MLKKELSNVIKELDLNNLYNIRDEINDLINKKESSISLNSRLKISDIPMSYELKKILEKNSIKTMTDLISKKESIKGIGIKTSEELGFILNMYNFNNIDESNNKKLDKKI